MKLPIRFNDDIIIRPSKISDAKPMVKFINELVREKVDINRNKTLTLKKEVESLKKLISEVNKGKAVSLAALKDNEVIGHTGITIKSGKSSHIGEAGLSIKKCYRRIGLGEALMSNAIRLAKEKIKGIEAIEAEAFVRNKASRGLLRKVGFKQVALIKKRFKFEGNYYDGVMLYKWLL